MAKSRYWLNPDTLSFEPLKISLRARFKRALWVFSICTVVALSGIHLYSRHFDTPKALSLRRSNAELASKVELLRMQIREAGDFLSQVELRDNNVYRPTFGMEVIPLSVREQGIGGANRYAALEESKYADLLIGSSKDLDKLMKKVYIQSISFDAVAKEANNISEMSKCVPAILPVSTAERNRVGTNFGMRIDPIFGDWRMHQGIDIGGKVGEPVFVTGNGVVERTETGKGWGQFLGYGNMVVVNHGFGYKTCYAHLNTVNVEEGEQVIRGQKIGTLGNTGKSTSPHLHYEVRYLDKAVNPTNYFALDMTEKEYENMLRFSQKAFGSEN